MSSRAFLHQPGRVANPGRCGIPKQSEDRKVPLETYLLQGSEIQRDPAPAKASLGLLSGKEGTSWLVLGIVSARLESGLPFSGCLGEAFPLPRVSFFGGVF